MTDILFGFTSLHLLNYMHTHASHAHTYKHAQTIRCTCMQAENNINIAPVMSCQILLL